MLQELVFSSYLDPQQVVETVGATEMLAEVICTQCARVQPSSPRYFVSVAAFMKLRTCELGSLPKEGGRTTSGSEFNDVEGEGLSGPLGVVRSYRLWKDDAIAEVCYESGSKSFVSVLTLPRYPLTTPDS
jgi:hypothetical protein